MKRLVFLVGLLLVTFAVSVFAVSDETVITAKKVSKDPTDINSPE